MNPRMNNKIRITGIMACLDAFVAGILVAGHAPDGLLVGLAVLTLFGLYLAWGPARDAANRRP